MTYTIYIVQAASILFAFALAKHDAAAIRIFEQVEAVPNLFMARFHRYNNWSKFAFCLIAAATGIPDGWIMGFAGLLSALWIYLVFDIVLNKNRGRSWDYIGNNDADGRRWIKWFGDRAGELKALILFGAILTVNAAIIVKDLL